MKLVIASTSRLPARALDEPGRDHQCGHDRDIRRYRTGWTSATLFLAAWGFPVLAVWGFNARWLPVFLGLRKPSGGGLMAALAACGCGVGVALLGQFRLATALTADRLHPRLHRLESIRTATKAGEDSRGLPSFPYFVRGAYAWLLVAAALGVYAANSDANGGIWGASRHALTVGFLATMVFAIGQRVLPAFCGMRLLFNKELMFASLAVLNLGCLLRVASEVPLTNSICGLRGPSCRFRR